MELKNLIETYSPFVKRHFLPLVFGLLGLIFFAYGLISLFTSSQAQKSDPSFDLGQDSSQINEVKSQNIAVDIEGAVVKTGVYKFSQNSILQDVLIASGGLSSRADRNWVAKNINLAQKVTDGMKIYVPYVGDKTVLSASDNSQVSASSLINVNSVTGSELDSLPGVGAVAAQKIINGRPYSALNDLLSKKIVSSKVFSEIKDKISIY